MNEDKVFLLLDIIEEIVAAEGAWKEKRDYILGQCNEAQQTALTEFCAWFDDTVGEQQ